eukprot:9480542-Pyramimonas_sp.AAC.1
MSERPLGNKRDMHHRQEQRLATRRPCVLSMVLLVLCVLVRLVRGGAMRGGRAAPVGECLPEHIRQVWRRLREHLLHGVYGPPPPFQDPPRHLGEIRPGHSVIVLRLRRGHDLLHPTCGAPHIRDRRDAADVAGLALQRVRGLPVPCVEKLQRALDGDVHLMHVAENAHDHNQGLRGQVPLHSLEHVRVLAASVHAKDERPGSSAVAWRDGPPRRRIRPRRASDRPQLLDVEQSVRHARALCHRLEVPDNAVAASPRGPGRGRLEHGHKRVRIGQIGNCILGAIDSHYRGDQGRVDLLPLHCLVVRPVALDEMDLEAARRRLAVELERPEALDDVRPVFVSHDCLVVSDVPADAVTRNHERSCTCPRVASISAEGQVVPPERGHISSRSPTDKVVQCPGLPLLLDELRANLRRPRCVVIAAGCHGCQRVPKPLNLGVLLFDLLIANNQHTLALNLVVLVVLGNVGAQRRSCHGDGVGGAGAVAAARGRLATSVGQRHWRQRISDPHSPGLSRLCLCPPGEQRPGRAPLPTVGPAPHDVGQHALHLLPAGALAIDAAHDPRDQPDVAAARGNPQLELPRGIEVGAEPRRLGDHPHLHGPRSRARIALAAAEQQEARHVVVLDDALHELAPQLPLLQELGNVVQERLRRLLHEAAQLLGQGSGRKRGNAALGARGKRPATVTPRRS